MAARALLALGMFCLIGGLLAVLWLFYREGE